MLRNVLEAILPIKEVQALVEHVGQLLDLLAARRGDDALDAVLVLKIGPRRGRRLIAKLLLRRSPRGVRGQKLPIRRLRQRVLDPGTWP